MPEHLTEHVSDWRDEVVVERTTRTIRNVALAGAISKNGYRYSDASLKTAAALYENVPVFLDHPASPHRPRDRSARDLAGSVANARYEEGRLRGDLRTLDTEAGRTLLALAETAGPGVGMSHVVLAERSRDGATVERIVEVISVDAVAFPATTTTFRESASNTSTTLNPVPLSLARAAKGEGSEDGHPASCNESLEKHRDHREPESSRQGDPSPPAPLPREKGVQVERLTQCPSRSLERLLAQVDTQLPGHLRRLAAATDTIPRGRGVRVGVFPKHVVVEWGTAGGQPQLYALEWQSTNGELSFGDSLLPFETVAERLESWHDTPQLHQETHDAHRQIEQLTERLRQTTAERDQLTERLTAPPVTSVRRRHTTVDRIADDVFVRTIRRR